MASPGHSLSVDPVGYRKLKDYWRERCGGRVQKVSLFAGMTCPNRDGTLGTGGCFYCSNEAFTPMYCNTGESLERQMELGLEFQRKRYPRAVGFLGYLQAYTNTYGPMEQLVETYETVLNNPEFMGMVIGTRPDCLPDSLLDWLVEASRRKVIYIELGIESFSDEVLRKMNRGHSFADAEDALARITERGLLAGGHFLVGFPGEPWQSFFEQVDRLNALPLHSVKVHQLHVFKDTPLANMYRKQPEAFHFPEKDEYLANLVEWLPKVRPDLYIDRVFGDAPFKYILNPGWRVRLDVLVRELDALIEAENVRQGSAFKA
jgi:radical SAM protein (TIGR01212 family)